MVNMNVTCLESQSLYLATAVCWQLGRFSTMDLEEQAVAFGFTSMTTTTVSGYDVEVTLMERLQVPKLENQSLYPLMAVCLQSGQMEMMKMVRIVAVFGFTLTTVPLVSGNNLAVTSMVRTHGTILDTQSLYQMMAVCWQLGRTRLIMEVKTTGAQFRYSGTLAMSLLLHRQGSQHLNPHLSQPHLSPQP